MQYHIQTSPIWDAFRENDGCPMCRLYERAESRLINQYLDEAVMEPEYRIKVNKRGFCSDHLKKLYAGGNKLGLALQLHTRTESVLDDIEMTDSAKKSGRLADKLAKTLETCVICDEVDEIMTRYAYTVAQMYFAEADFPKVFDESAGFCLKHFIQLLRYVSHASKAAEKYAKALTKKQIESLRKTNAELERFTKRFDYRSSDKFSAGTDDALKNSVNKLKGKIITD